MKLTSTEPVSHIKITQAGLVALLTTVVGQLVAFVPSIASSQQILISAGSTVLAAVFLIANAVHSVAGSHTSVKVIEQDVTGAVKAELARILSQGIGSVPAAPPVVTVPVSTPPTGP